MIMQAEPDELTARVSEIAEQSGGFFLSPYDHPKIIEGHASCGIEIVEELAGMAFSPSHVICPVSGGGLSAGVSFALKCLCPGAHLTGVEPEGADDFRESLEQGKLVSFPRPKRSIADGLLANSVGESNQPVLLQCMDDAFAVSDEEIIEAMKFLFEKEGLVVEPSGAIGVAALLSGKVKPVGESIVIVISGRNVDIEKFNIWVMTKD